MTRPLVVEFAKMHGAGNDFVVVDNRFFHFSDAELSTLARWWCPRRTGIGADGLLALAPPSEAGHDYRMRYVNADGSRARMCGNGARCLARFAREAGLGDGEVLTFASDAGVYRARVPASRSAPVRLYVPPPEDFVPRVELAGEQEEVLPSVHYVWTGTEHAVCFVDDVAQVPVEAWGRAIRRDAALAPAGANADFVQVVAVGDGEGNGALRVRTYEKGVEAETQACGTGALAAAVVARLLGRIETGAIPVHMPGGTLRAGLEVDAGAVTELYLEGPVAKVFRGTVDVDPQVLTEASE